MVISGDISALLFALLAVEIDATATRRHLLRAHGLPQDALHLRIHNVAIATLLYRLHYASPSWWGMTYSADDRLKMERFINKLRRLGYLPANRAAMETMIDVTDRGLLRAVVTRNNHVLLSLFPPILATI